MWCLRRPPAEPEHVFWTNSPLRAARWDPLGHGAYLTHAAGSEVMWEPLWSTAQRVWRTELYYHLRPASGACMGVAAVALGAGRGPRGGAGQTCLVSCCSDGTVYLALPAYLALTRFPDQAATRLLCRMEGIVARGAGGAAVLARVQSEHPLLGKMSGPLMHGVDDVEVVAAEDEGKEGEGGAASGAAPAVVMLSLHDGTTPRSRQSGRDGRFSRGLLSAPCALHCVAAAPLSRLHGLLLRGPGAREAEGGEAVVCYGGAAGLIRLHVLDPKAALLHK